MVTTTKASIDSITSSIENSLRASKTSWTSKAVSELYKTDDSKSEDFQKYLSSRTNSKDQEDTQKVNSVNDNDAAAKETKVSDANETKDVDDADELKEKLDELEEKSKDESKTDSKDNASDVLTELLALLAKLGLKEDIKVDGKINLDALKNILNKINSDKSSSTDLNNIMESVMKLLKNDSVKGNLDTNSLKTIENILSNLNSKLANDNSEASKDVKNNIKSLMSEISNMLNNSQEHSKKVLSLEEMLNKNYSQSNSENSSGDESSNSTAESKDNKELSKEDKFLNSLISDDKDSSADKINLFASRNAAIQNQGVNTTVRGLTINKATFADDLIKDVKYMSNNSLKELTVKLNPGNLGEITIKLVQEDGLMKANIKANSKETTALLSQNLAEIKKQLSEQSIKVSDVNIELYQDDTTFFKDQGFEGQLSGEQNRQNNKSQSAVAGTEAISSEELDENLAKENSEINFFA